MNKVLVLAPHPDDETLGCGGTLLRHLAEGDSVHWLIVTAMTPEAGFSAAQRRSRSSEIEKVRKAYGFKGLHSLGFSTTRLDDLPMAEIVRKMGEVFQKLLPEVVYLPFRGDVHTDHRIVFDAAVACTKWFRMSSVRRVLSYETPSETGFGLGPESPFTPNVFVDISAYLERKIEIMNLYEGELGRFPFPRSAEALRALGAVRGSCAGFRAAESFMLLKERC